MVCYSPLRLSFIVCLVLSQFQHTSPLERETTAEAGVHWAVFSTRKGYMLIKDGDALWTLHQFHSSLSQPWLYHSCWIFFVLYSDFQSTMFLLSFSAPIYVVMVSFFRKSTFDGLNFVEEIPTVCQPTMDLWEGYLEVLKVQLITLSVPMAIIIILECKRYYECSDCNLLSFNFHTCFIHFSTEAHDYTQ